MELDGLLLVRATKMIVENNVLLAALCNASLSGVPSEKVMCRLDQDIYCRVCIYRSFVSS